MHSVRSRNTQIANYADVTMLAAIPNSCCFRPRAAWAVIHTASTRRPPAAAESGATWSTAAARPMPIRSGCRVSVCKSAARAGLPRNATALGSSAPRPRFAVLSRIATRCASRPVRIAACLPVPQLRYTSTSREPRDESCTRPAAACADARLAVVLGGRALELGTQRPPAAGVFDPRWEMPATSKRLGGCSAAVWLRCGCCFAVLCCSEGSCLVPADRVYAPASSSARVVAFRVFGGASERSAAARRIRARTRHTH